MQELHPLQLQILRKLLFSPKLRYTDLKPDEEIENNQLSFHLNKLIDSGWVAKEDSYYVLTQTGKEFANRMDTDTVKIKPQAKITLLCCAVRHIDGEPEYLLYTRLKHPFYGSQGFPTGKLMRGESIYDGVLRELQEETSLTATRAELFTIRHYLVYSNQGELLEDKFMFMFKIENPSGEIKSNEEGKYEWVKESQFGPYLTKPFDDLYEVMDVLKKFTGEVEVKEFQKYTKEF